MAARCPHADPVDAVGGEGFDLPDPEDDDDEEWPIDTTEGGWAEETWMGRK